MKRSTYSEEQIEQLLQQMPKVQDKQDPAALFERLSSQLTDPIEKPKKKVKRMWIYPTVASLAAVLLIALIAPSFLSEQMSFSNDAANNESYDQSMSMESVQESTTDSGNLEKSKSLSIQEDKAEDSNSSTGFGIVATLEEKSIKIVPENMRLITVAIPAPEAQVVVPVSFLAPLEPVQTDIEQLNNLKTQINIEGLSNGYLSEVLFSLDKNEERTVQVNVMNSHTFGQGSASETMFLTVIKETFRRMGYNQVKFYTDGKLGIELGNYGIIETLSLMNNEQRGYFIFKGSENSPLVLVPNTVTKDANFQDSLLSMKNSYQENQLNASIPTTVDFKSVTENGEVVTITFSNDTNLFAQQEYVTMIDAILLTAGEFGFTKVIFENTEVQRIGPYDLTQPLLSAVAPNPLDYPSR